MRNISRLLGNGLITLIIGISVASIAHAEISKEHMAIIDASHNAIFSAEVLLDVELEYPLKTVTHVVDGKSISEWVEWDASEEPLKERYRYKQLIDVDGRYYVQEFDTTNQHNNDVKAFLVFDGGYSKHFSPLSRQGYIGSRDPQMTSDNQDYALCTNRLFGTVTVKSLLKERASVASSVIKTIDNKLILELDLPALPLTSLPQFHFVARFRADRGYAIDNVEMRNATRGDAVLNHVKVVDWKRLEDGAWAPVEATIENHNCVRTEKTFGKVVNLYHLKVDQSASRWNFPVNDAMFKIEFPAGTKMLDKVNNFTYQTGSVSAGDTIDYMLKNASNVVKLNDRKLKPLNSNDSNGSSIFRKYFIYANIVLIVVLVALIITRRRRRI